MTPPGAVGVDNSPATIKNFLAYSLRRLGTDYIDICRPARLDPKVPIEDTIGASPNPPQGACPICDLQIEYSLISRGIENSILPALRELGIGLTAYGVLSRGLISGHWSKTRAGEQDFRAISPRFRGENLDKNLTLVEKLRELASVKRVTVAQLAIAWVLAQGKDIGRWWGSHARPAGRGARCARCRTQPHGSCRDHPCRAGLTVD